MPVWPSRGTHKAHKTHTTHVQNAAQRPDTILIRQTHTQAARNLSYRSISSILIYPPVANFAASGPLIMNLYPFPVATPLLPAATKPFLSLTARNYNLNYVKWGDALCLLVVSRDSLQNAFTGNFRQFCLKPNADKCEMPSGQWTIEPFGKNQLPFLATKIVPSRSFVEWCRRRACRIWFDFKLSATVRPRLSIYPSPSIANDCEEGN